MSFPFLPKLRPAGCGDPGAEIPFSCLFDGAQYLAHTPTAVGDRKTFTFSRWIKRAKLGAVQMIFQACTALAAGQTRFYVRFQASGELYIEGGAIQGGAATISWLSASVFRDPAAWLHLEVTVDTTQAVAANRLTVRINGDQIAASGTPTYPPQNYLTAVNTTGPHWIGRYYDSSDGTTGYPSDYHADTILLDGIAAAPEAFGYRNRYGIWVPRRYTGDHGPGGCHLDFADPLDLGKDVSGNGNHWTSVGLTAANQSPDTPTHGYATLLPLDTVHTYSDGALKVVFGPSGNAGKAACSTLPIPATGRWYWEAKWTAGHKDWAGVGIIGSVLPSTTDGNHRHYLYLGNPYKSASGTVSAYGTAWASGDIIGTLYDADAGTIEYFRSGVSQGIAFAGIDASQRWLACVRHWTNTYTNTFAVNFGQRAFTYPANQGTARALCTAALPCPPIKRPERYFATRLRSAGAGVADLPWSPLTVKTLVLSKRRDSATDWRVNDSLRPGRAWATNTAAADFAEADGLTFTDTGYTIGAAAAYAGSRADYIWRASAAAGFDIVLVDHVAGTPTTVPHAAGGIIDYAWVVPLAGGSRRVYHRSLAAGKYLTLDGTGAAATDAGWFISSAVDLTLGASLPTGRYALYLWRAVPGFSAFGTYASNYSADGPFLPMDFRPAALLAKYDTTGTTNGVLIDAARSPANPVSAFLNPNAASVEGAATLADFVANGVKVRMVGTDLSTLNFTTAGTFIFAAWAETPLKFARAR